MATEVESDEVFDEEELADGFDEEIVSEEELEDAVEDIDDDEASDDEASDDDATGDEPIVEVALVEEDEVVAVAVVTEDDDDVVDDADVELALDEVLAETILRTSVPEDDDEVPLEIDPTVDAAETILPKQDDEFRCKSCRLLKKTSQLADKANSLCRDCV